MSDTSNAKCGEFKFTHTCNLKYYLLINIIFIWINLQSYGHLKFLCPTCVSLCSLRCSDLMKDFPQPSTLHWNLRSLVCFCWWRFNLLALEKDHPQSWNRKLFLNRVKGKGLPQQAEMALGVPDRLRLRIFSNFYTTRVVFRQPNAPASFTPGEIPGTHFQRLSRPQGTCFCRKEPRKKSPVTPPGIDPGTVRLVAQRLNHWNIFVHTPNRTVFLQSVVDLTGKAHWRKYALIRWNICNHSPLKLWRVLYFILTKSGFG